MRRSPCRYGASPDGSISWDAITVSPNQAATFPVESGPSHYYKARDTDATPLSAGWQIEKFLFYRGVGQFAPPISATVRPTARSRRGARRTRRSAI